MSPHGGLTSIFWTDEGVRPGDMEWAEAGDISGVRTCSPITQISGQIPGNGPRCQAPSGVQGQWSPSWKQLE